MNCILTFLASWQVITSLLLNASLKKLKLYIIWFVCFIRQKCYFIWLNSVSWIKKMILYVIAAPYHFLHWYSINAESVKMSCWYGNRCRTSYISLQRKTSRISSYLSVYTACRCLSSCCVMFTQQAISQLVKALNGICSQSLLCIPKDF